MTQQQVNQLAAKGIFRGRKLRGKIVETHISWVILSGHYAFKIKKPIKLPFLDFSTLSKRSKLAHHEIKVNRRLTDIYQEVVPVKFSDNKFLLGHPTGRVIDYAVQMKRLAAPKRMDVMLEKNKVDDEDIFRLAKKIASFHKNAQVIQTPFSLRKSENLFNDIRSIIPYAEEHLGHSFVSLIRKSIKWSNHFLRNHEKRFQQRIKAGLVRDGHGDLHSANIFLYEDPVLFDCIEFKDEFRHIDVLYEIAFLCMELESLHQDGKSAHMLHMYLDQFDCLTTREDEKIFNYFKCLRANVRAKVHALSIEESDTEAETALHLFKFKKYLQLMEIYMHQ